MTSGMKFHPKLHPSPVCLCSSSTRRRSSISDICWNMNSVLEEPRGPTEKRQICDLLGLFYKLINGGETNGLLNQDISCSALSMKSFSEIILNKPRVLKQHCLCTIWLGLISNHLQHPSNQPETPRNYITTHNNYT